MSFHQISVGNMRTHLWILYKSGHSDVDSESIINNRTFSEVAVSRIFLRIPLHGCPVDLKGSSNCSVKCLLIMLNAQWSSKRTHLKNIEYYIKFCESPLGGKKVDK